MYCFQERGWLTAALSCEALCGMAWRCAALVGAAPERSPLAATARAHLSSGAALACVLAPRLWHGYRARSLAQEVSPAYIHTESVVLFSFSPKY